MAELIELSVGKVTGQKREGVLEFLGIPYAEPLHGLARVRLPVPRKPWAGVFEASQYGMAVPQDAPAFMAVGPMGEDCLSINVWTPDRMGRLPVMVWLHGGGYLTGSTAQPLYRGDVLARREDVVVVSFNYRIGMMGYADFREYPELAADTNNGIRDQLLALTWIKEHIAAFGGDPECITLFGESAGGMAIATLLAVPAASGLFHRAIVQSGSADHVLEPGEAQKVARAFVGEGNDPSVLVTGPWSDLLRAARACHRLVLQRGVHSQPICQFGMPALPVIDGDVLPEAPLEAARAGRLQALPLLIGTTKDEWNLFIHAPQMMGGSPGKKDIPDEAVLERVFERAVPGRGSALAEAYRQAMPGASRDERIGAFETDRIFRVPSLRLAEQQPDSSYVYRFDWPCAGNRQLGACHVVDVPFVFGLVDEPIGQFFTGGGESAQALSAHVQSAWASFARRGKPQAKEWPVWPAYGSERATLLIGEMTTLDFDPESARRRIWDDVI